MASVVPSGGLAVFTLQAAQNALRRNGIPAGAHSKFSCDVAVSASLLVQVRSLTKGEADERRFSGDIEQLLSIRLAISRQSQH